jgi:hypothetical protein
MDDQEALEDKTRIEQENEDGNERVPSTRSLQILISKQIHWCIP